MAAHHPVLKDVHIGQSALERSTVKSDTGMSHFSGGGNNHNAQAFAGLMMVKRRMGRWKRGAKAGSTFGGSSVKSAHRLPIENSYQLKPKDTEKFDEARVRDVVEESLNLFLVKQSSYSAAKCSQVSRFISEDVKSRVKSLGFKRYKIVVNVMIGQTKDQGMEYASRCVWDTETDNVVSVTRQHKDKYVIVNVYGVYFE